MRCKRITKSRVKKKKQDLVLINKKERTHHLLEFAVSGDYKEKVNQRGKVTENERMMKYLDLARELKKQWNMKITMMSVVDGDFGTVPKNLE